MPLLKSTDLKYPYSPALTPQDSAKLTGEPDKTSFNRFEIYEVLYIVNKMAEKYNFKHLYAGLKAERLIREHLPRQVSSQVNVMHWLHSNWNRHD